MNWHELIPYETLALAGRLDARARQEAAEGKRICPPVDSIFRALDLTPPERTKVVIIGQDPYHTPGQANGLAFSISPGHPIQPSLRNIFRELQDDMGVPEPSCGDLTPWAQQGVLLLNTSLTVYAGCANSHVNWGWQEFTMAICKAAMNLPQTIVFLLWGSSAHRFIPELDFGSHGNKFFEMSRHPSPMAQGVPNGRIPNFLGSRPFSKANAILAASGADPIDWRLP